MFLPKKIFIKTFIILQIFFCISCGQEENKTDKFAITTKNITKIDIENNIQIGEKIFSMPLGEDKLSCISCHQLPYFVDNLPTSVGFLQLNHSRNSPSLLNLKYQQAFFWDGREQELKNVVLLPIFNPQEINLKTKAQFEQEIQAKLKLEKPLSTIEIQNDLFLYLKALPQIETSYDLFLKNKYTLSSQEQYGKQLFEKNCSRCHIENNGFTDNQYHNFVFKTKIKDINTGLSLWEKQVQTPLNDNNLIVSNKDVASLGRYLVTNNLKDLNNFRTPSLRYVSKTAPYYHDGSQPDLKEVIQFEFYYRNPDNLQLTDDEANAILKFLNLL